jgi:uncharacterized lipoprotein YajG
MITMGNPFPACTRFAGPLACLLLVAGCAPGMENIRVDMPAYQSAGAAASAPAGSAQVKVDSVADARNESVGSHVGERTTIGEVSMGSIELEPLPTMLMTQVLKAELAKMGHPVVASGAQFSVGGKLLKFRVSTPATAVYWDINGEIELALAVKGQSGAMYDARYAATCTDRTYVWPGEEIIGKVLADCAGKIGAGLRGDAALAKFLGTR